MRTNRQGPHFITFSPVYVSRRQSGTIADRVRKLFFEVGSEMTTRDVAAALVDLPYEQVRNAISTLNESGEFGRPRHGVVRRAR